MYAQRTKCLDSLRGTHPRAEIISQAFAQSPSLQPPPPNCSGPSGVVSGSSFRYKTEAFVLSLVVHVHACSWGRGVHLWVLVQLKVSDPGSWSYNQL